MNAETPIEAEARLIPLNLLYLHAMNPRQNGSEADAEAMAQSIDVNGLMQNLMGYADPDRAGKIGIVAGGRRLHALMHLHAAASNVAGRANPEWPLIPVKVTDDPDLARSWAGAESTTQKPLHPADEIHAYEEMRNQGSSPDMIARAFAQTERHVKGRLALASLISEARLALRGNHISLDVAKALTVARDDTEQLSVLTAARSGDWNAHRVRQALTKETVASDDRKVLFIGVDLYLAEGGTMDADLFEDQTYLHDSELVDRLFAEKLEVYAENLRVEQGWQWVKFTTDEWPPHEMSKGLQVIHRTPIKLPEADDDECNTLQNRWQGDLSASEKDRLHELQSRRHGDYTDEDRETGGIVVKVKGNGILVIDDAYREQAKSSSDSSSTTGATPSNKPALTQAGTEDLRRIGLMALQGAMVDKSDFLLDLFAWQMERGAPSWSSPFAIELTDQPIKPEVEGSWHIDARLADPDTTEPKHDEDTAATFAAFRAIGKKHRNAVIARGLTRTLQIPNGKMAALGRVMAEFAGVEIRKPWTPDAPTYFSRLSVPAMESLWAELLEADADDERVAAFGKLKKAQKAKDLADLFANAEVQEAHGLTRDQIAKIDAWLPPELRGE